MSNYHSLQPSGFLVENVGLLPGGRTLDIAMGTGRNALFLAKRGFQVEGVDISSKSVAQSLVLAEEAGVYIKAKVADLESEYVIAVGAYDLIICFNYLQRSLIPQIKDGLRNGGMVVYETFISDQAKYGKPSNPDFLLKHNELLDMFSDLRCLRYREGIMPGRKAMASIVAEKI